jgi:hypothetical protein
MKRQHTTNCWSKEILDTKRGWEETNYTSGVYEQKIRQNAE